MHTAITRGAAFQSGEEFNFSKIFTELDMTWLCQGQIISLKGFYSYAFQLFESVCMCFCVCMCVCVCAWTPVSICVHFNSLRERVCVGVCVCVCVCGRVCVSVGGRLCYFLCVSHL